MNNKKMNRRKFIQTSTASLLAAGAGIPTFQKNQTDSPHSDKIVYRTLGRTKLRLPVVSFGVMNSDKPEMLRRALNMGIRHLDTAHVYLRGNSETVIGQVLEETKFRKKVIIATKMRFARDRKNHVFLKEGTTRQPGASEENLKKQLETSLKRLRTDYIDILYLHSCYSPAMVRHEKLMNALVKVKKSGLARFIGISTHSDEPNVIRAAVDAGVYDVIQTAYNYLQKHGQEVKKAIAYAAKKESVLLP